MACQTDLTADEIDYLPVVSELEECRRKNKILSEKLENKKLNYYKSYIISGKVT